MSASVDGSSRNLTASAERNRAMTVVDQVDSMSEEVKVLALNLAIYLAKAKPNSKRLHQLEPEFVRLVNGAVKVVQEITRIINAARNAETMTYEVESGRGVSDQTEIRLRSILDQCGRIISALSQTEDPKGQPQP